MAKIVIGEVEYLVQEMNFISIERAWPYIEEAMLTEDPMKGTSAGIRIIAAGLIEQEDFDKSKFDIREDEQLNEDQVFDRVTLFLKRKLKATEIIKVKDCVNKITEEAGLAPEEGEAPAPAEGAASPSTETAPPSSLSSSPQDAREEAGTA